MSRTGALPPIREAILLMVILGFNCIDLFYYFHR